MNEKEIPSLDVMFSQSVRSTIEIAKLIGLDKKNFINTLNVSWDIVNASSIVEKENKE